MLVNITPHNWTRYSDDAQARVIVYLRKKLGRSAVLQVSGAAIMISLQSRDPGKAWREELEALQNFNPEPCPCGCGADLVIGECSEVFCYFDEQERKEIRQDAIATFNGDDRFTSGKGGIIRAIKNLRNRTHLSLLAAKDKVDALFDLYSEQLAGTAPATLTPKEYAEIESMILRDSIYLSGNRDSHSDEGAWLVRKSLEVGRRVGINQGFALVFGWFDYMKAGGPRVRREVRDKGMKF